jgi:hypothetical protein
MKPTSLTHLSSLIRCSARIFTRLGIFGLIFFMTCVSLDERGFVIESVQAQSLDVKLDSSLSSGLIVGPNGREVSVGPAPLLIDFDAAFIFDGDESLEWVLGSIIQAKYTPAFAINPQVRLRRRWKLLEGFGGLGLPFFFTPYTRFGFELSLGASFPAEGAVALVAQTNLQSYFLGSDLPDDHAVFTINGAVGVRIRF